MKAKTGYVYEIQTLDTGKTNSYTKNASKAVVKYLKSFSSHAEAEEYVRSLKMESAYDIHYLRVHSKLHHITITPLK
jgi:hypothetical protein